MQVSEAALLMLFVWGTSFADTRAHDTALTDQISAGCMAWSIFWQKHPGLSRIQLAFLKCEHHELEEKVFSHAPSIVFRAWQALEAAAAAVAEATEELRYEAADLAEE